MVKVDELKAACSLEDAVLWDVRSDGEYSGAGSRGNQRAGHLQRRRYRTPARSTQRSGQSTQRLRLELFSCSCLSASRGPLRLFVLAC